MRSMFLLLQLILAFAFSLHQVQPDSPPGFISLDCGLQDTYSYNDPFTGLNYTTDGDYIETGESRSISPDFKTNTLQQQFYNVRSFPGPKGTRNCYTFKPLYGKNNQILLRVSFMYGNYDDQNTVPQFDLYLGANYWETVTLEDASSQFVSGIIHKPTSDYMYVCLVNTGQGTPFISIIELRSMDPSKPAYNTTSGSLKNIFHRNLGSTSNNLVRYKDDAYDRLWSPINKANTTILSSNATNFNQNWFMLPTIVMNTAAQAPTTNDPLIVSFVPNNSSDQFYVYLHFAELLPNKSREMNIYVNGLYCYGPFVPDYEEVYTVFIITPMYGYPKYEFLINATSNSMLPAILNAFEAYIIKQFPYYETDEDDVAAITGIKTSYAVTRNWQGDPCLPNKFAWVGLNCSYNGFEPPNIISLNLSSSGLNGTIAPSIANLTMLQSLDLSYNNLTGQVPEFLSWLPSLKYLYLGGNNFTGSLPPELLERSKNGSLILSMENANRTNPCANDACMKKKNTNIVPIVASVASIFAVFAFSTLFIILWRKWKVVQRVNTAESGNDGSSIEPKLRRFTYSEIMSFIGDMTSNILGEGGFGTVYRRCINGVEVAIKVLKESPQQQTRDFQFEVNILATVHHKNLTRILGYCHEGLNKAIIFELMEKGNLSNHLSETNPNVLTLEQRLTILVGAAQGLEYLHHGCEPPIIHRDIKPANILLTEEFEAKLGDFGLARIFPVQSSRVMGTDGYVDPEYIRDSSTLSNTTDVYSFGVVVLVVLTGKPAVMTYGGTRTHISQWVDPNIRNRDIRGIVDPRLQGNYDANACWSIVKLAMGCVSSESSHRPSMHTVVRELKDCLPSTEPDGRRSSNAAGGITALPSMMRSLFRPNTR